MSEQISRARYLCNIIFGVAVVLCGIFLFLCGLGIIPLNSGDVALPSILLSMGGVFIATAFVQKNSVSLWISFFFTVTAIIILFVVYVDLLNYSNMYPFFVSIPAFASLFTMIMTKHYKTHLKSAGFFSMLTIILCLQSFGLFDWEVIVPCLVIFLGSIVLTISLLKH